VPHYVLHDSFPVKEAPDSNIQLPAVYPDDNLYIIFTSGSTGKPKGALISHSAYGTGAIEHRSAMNIGPDSRVYQFASYRFGASIVEILSTLIAGGCVCIPSDADRVANIASAIGAMRANLAIFTPSFASFLDPARLESLKTVVFAGEALRSTVVNAWADHVTLISGYGQSEASVCCSSNTDISRQGSNYKSIGRSFGSRIWIGDMNDHNLLAPVGAVGEMFVEGPILSAGYFDNALGTDQAFVMRPSNWIQEQR
jgi:non-ribosomal peptide synthetase component F